MSNSQGLIMFLKHFNTFVIFFLWEFIGYWCYIFSPYFFFPCGSISKHFKLHKYTGFFFFFLIFINGGGGGRQWPPLPYCRSITEELDKIYKIYLIDTDRLGKKISPQFFLPLSFFTIFFSIIRWWKAQLIV